MSVALAIEPIPITNGKEMDRLSLLGGGETLAWLDAYGSVSFVTVATNDGFWISTDHPTESGLHWEDVLAWAAKNKCEACLELSSWRPLCVQSTPPPATIGEYYPLVAYNKSSGIWDSGAAGTIRAYWGKVYIAWADLRGLRPTKGASDGQR